MSTGPTHSISTASGIGINTSGIHSSTINVPGGYTYIGGDTGTLISLGDISPWARMTGESFDSSLIFPTDFCITEPRSVMHFKTFLCLHPEICDHSYVILPPTHEALLCFSSRESASLFTEWLGRYRSRFFSRVRMSEGLVPRLDQDRISTVTLVPSRESLWNEADLVETWAWIVRNCNAPVYKIERMLAFESEIDATLFKMHFSG
jgi:hypothetical protein